MFSDCATDDPKPDYADVCVLSVGRRRGTLHEVGSSTTSLPTKVVPRNREFSPLHRFNGSTLQSEFRKIVERNRADSLKTLYADLVHRIAGGVPRGIIEINDVDRRNPDRV